MVELKRLPVRVGFRRQIPLGTEMTDGCAFLLHAEQTAVAGLFMLASAMR